MKTITDPRTRRPDSPSRKNSGSAASMTRPSAPDSVERASRPESIAASTAGNSRSWMSVRRFESDFTNG